MQHCRHSQVRFMPNVLDSTTSQQIISRAIHHDNEESNADLDQHQHAFSNTHSLKQNHQWIDSMQSDYH